MTPPDQLKFQFVSGLFARCYRDQRNRSPVVLLNKQINLCLVQTKFGINDLRMHARAVNCGLLLTIKLFNMRKLGFFSDIRQYMVIEILYIVAQCCLMT